MLRRSKEAEESTERTGSLDKKIKELGQTEGEKGLFCQLKVRHIKGIQPHKPKKLDLHGTFHKGPLPVSLGTMTIQNAK